MPDFIRADVRKRNGSSLETLDLNVFVNPEKLLNCNEIKWDGVTCVQIVVDDEEYHNPRIVQASGYTEDRGLFCDMY